LRTGIPFAEGNSPSKVPRMELDLLEKWVKQNSGTRNPDGLARMADALMERLSRLPGSLERIPLPACTSLEGAPFTPGDAVRLRFREDAPLRILLSGHMDTVFTPDDPFQNVTRLPDGSWKGPGIADMKGGLFIMIEALDRFLQEDTSGCLGGEILITADEEIGSPASRDLLVETAKRHHLGLVFESSLPGRELVSRRMGTGTFTVSASGRSAHTGRDFENGRNAVAGLAWCAVKAHALNQQLDDTIINVGRFSGGGALNVVPDEARMWLNVRVGTLQAVGRLETVFKELIQDANRTWEGMRFTCDGEFTRPPKEESAAEARLHELWNTAQRSLGYEPSGKRATGGSSDGNLFAGAGLPHLDGVGIRGGAIHSREEFAFPESLPEQIETTVAFLKKLCQADHLIPALTSETASHE